MSQDRTSLTSVAGRPLHPLLVPIPILCFLGVLLTDLAYAVAPSAGIAQASLWLLEAGLGAGAVAGLIGAADYLGNERIMKLRDADMHVLAIIVGLGLEASNYVARALNGASIVPTGLALSAASAVILAYAIWRGRMIFRRNR